jgi:hypothetical protein
MCEVVASTPALLQHSVSIDIIFPLNLLPYSAQLNQVNQILCVFVADQTCSIQYLWFLRRRQQNL